MHTHTDHNRSGSRGRTAVAAAAGLLLAAGTVVGLGVSQAHADAAPTSPEIRTTADLNVRWAPSINAVKRSMVDNGQQLPVTCKLPGSVVDGNGSWYALPGEGHEYVSGRYVKELTKVPTCTGSGEPVQAFVEQRTWTSEGPNLKDPTTGVALQEGTRLHVTCYITAQKVNDTKRWYLVDNNEWVPASGISVSGVQPQYCG